MTQPATTPPTDVIVVRDLRILFPTRDGHDTVKAVDGMDFEVRTAETFGIIGESGSGKTTLGRALVSLLKPTEGQILHQGVDPAALGAKAFRKHRRDYQIVFQDPNAALNPRMTIIDSVMEPLEIVGEGDAASRRRRGIAALERVGLSPEAADRYPHQLSGGQKQRVNIARVLTLRPKVIVCDEVVAALDVSIRGDVLNLFADLQREFGLTYVFITHDISVVSHISDRIAVTYLGKLMELGPAEDVIEHPLHPYTRALLSAEPIPLPSHLRVDRRIILEGEIPSPVAPPSGCRFRTRCPSVRPRCADEVPAWREVRPGHRVACHFATADGPPPDQRQVQNTTIMGGSTCA
ncbi:ABC transporter ATP-binding protein [Rhodopseudomonas palustris]|uniref:ABC transporter ATP-binding protein n=1 Tax=Rhodopseudomonas palustris TaxID=1076 RepID=UPI000E5B51FB|nr:oligopeptide/dipeptide ABC transporter ATP-binding protein [Rhodopseudomonas palustris]QLH70551.1 ATP-binding cassette domain-containing protein [Rhodopseudomonas palustris]RHZ95127.1 ATP-binding cassette domain-containing protein [Rhodopseudomonas palustris]